MSRVLWCSILGLGGWMAMVSSACGQAAPYIGYVYPAGGQQGTTFQVRLGGQRIDDVSGAIVSGKGVSARLVQYFRKMGPQDMTLLNEQLKELRPKPAKKDEKNKKEQENKKVQPDPAALELIARIEKRTAEYVQRPACAAISSIAFLEVTIAPDAEPGPRELRLVTQRGISNPLVFQVGQLPEVSRKPMITSSFQVLGKEGLSLRKRPDEEVEDQITLPCTMNGQIASGEMNRYRFQAKKGQRLVISVQARQLIPYIADAVPGWFQPVLVLYDEKGKEVAYNDDYRFKPDPTLFCEVPKDGQYVLAIADAIYRGREDFVYRMTIGELPYLTSIFPLGGRAGTAVSVAMDGWNLQKARLVPPPNSAEPGIYPVAAKKGKTASNSLPFALDTLPECFDQESNNESAHAQKLKLPVIVNGRVDRPDDWDVFQIDGHQGETIVAEVSARRLDSPMDSLLKVTDSSGKLLAMNDDHEDPGNGANTHHADSYVMVKLPANGTYYVHLGDTARHGGKEYAYRLRISGLQPDFALRVVPSSTSFRGKGQAALSIYAIRKDGFAGDIKLSLKDPPAGFSSSPVVLPAGKETVRLTLKTTLATTEQPVNLAIEGRATIQKREVVHQAVPAEDRMQAFLWRHLLPAAELKALVFDPSYEPPLPRALPPPPTPKETPAAPVAAIAQAAPAAPTATATPAAPAAGATSAATASPASAPPKAPAESAAKGKFTKQQVAGRLRQLKLLYEEWLLTESFYNRKVAECEAPP